MKSLKSLLNLPSPSPSPSPSTPTPTPTPTRTSTPGGAASPTLRKQSSRAARSVAVVALLALFCGGCQTTAFRTRPTSSDDVNLGIKLPQSLANVWYRADVQPQNFIPFADSGTLLVTTDSILFSSETSSLTIPTRAIRNVVWRQMDGDLQNEWAVIIWADGGTDRMLGFTAANGYRYDTSNKALYSAIVVASKSGNGRL